MPAPCCFLIFQCSYSVGLKMLIACADDGRTLISATVRDRRQPCCWLAPVKRSAVHDGRACLASAMPCRELALYSVIIPVAVVVVTPLTTSSSPKYCMACGARGCPRPSPRTPNPKACSQGPVARWAHHGQGFSDARGREASSGMGSRGFHFVEVFGV